MINFGGNFVAISAKTAVKYFSAVFSCNFTQPSNLFVEKISSIKTSDPAREQPNSKNKRARNKYRALEIAEAKDLKITVLKHHSTGQ